MRGMGQQIFMGSEQFRYFFGGQIKAQSQPGDFILALHRQAGRKIAIAQGIELIGQRFQPAGQSAGQRQGANGHGQCHQGQPSHPPVVFFPVPWRPHNQQPLIRHPQLNQPGIGVIRTRLAGAGDQLTAGIK